MLMFLSPRFLWMLTVFSGALLILLASFRELNGGVLPGPWRQSSHRTALNSNVLPHRGDSSSVYTSSDFSQIMANRAKSRACVLYVPDKSSVTVRETFSFIESWKTIFQRPYTPDQLATNSTTGAPQNKVQVSAGFSKNGKYVFPWLESLRQIIWDSSFADPSPLLTESQWVLKQTDGPPLITDLIIIASPKLSSERITHPDCIALSVGESLLNGLSANELQSLVNLTGRLDVAQRRLSEISKSSSNWRNRPVNSRMQEATYGESKCFYIQAELRTESANLPFDRHPVINSIACLLVNEIAALLKTYDLLLRSDADCFLTPHFNDPRLIPWQLESPSGFLESDAYSWTKELVDISTNCQVPTQLQPFMTGSGGYSGEEQNSILVKYAAFLGLQHQQLFSVGSTWYGHSGTILQVGYLSVTAAEFLLKYDPLFKQVRGVGEWPYWYRGVLTLYAAELAINHLIHKSRYIRASGLLDSESTLNTTFVEKAAIHIHCWHTDRFFSKFNFYPDNLVLSDEMRILAPNWYSLVHNKAGEFIDRKAKAIKLTPKTFDPAKDHLVSDLVPLYDRYFSCSRGAKGFPYSFASGQKCCSTDIDCDGQPLRHDSECCRNASMVCPSASVCYDSRKGEKNFADFLSNSIAPVRQQLRNMFKKFPANEGA